eukprot:761887-Hanusia_phi.AAC.1
MSLAVKEVRQEVRGMCDPSKCKGRRGEHRRKRRKSTMLTCMLLWTGGARAGFSNRRGTELIPSSCGPELNSAACRPLPRPRIGIGAAAVSPARLVPCDSDTSPPARRSDSLPGK